MAQTYMPARTVPVVGAIVAFKLAVVTRRRS